MMCEERCETGSVMCHMDGEILLQNDLLKCAQHLTNGKQEDQFHTKEDPTEQIETLQMIKV